MLFANVFSGLILSLGLLLPGSGAIADKTARQDCCTKDLICCGNDHDRACCVATAKLGCCAKAMNCCGKDKACCAAVQPCCTEGDKCCEQAKACCAASGKQAAKTATAKGCCGQGKCCCAE
jgi:hypothetical protein